MNRTAQPPLPILLALLCAALWSCDAAPVTGRRQLMLVSEKQELAMGQAAARRILQTTPVVRDPAVNETMRRVGRRLTAASGEPDLPWEFYVLDDPATSNAFALPGGKIFIYSGMLDNMTDEDELAVVLAHEIAHALARHGAERAGIELAAQIGGAVLRLALNDQDPLVASLADKLWGLGSNLGIMLPYSRKQEYEADHIGLTLMRKAGYDLDAAARFWASGPSGRAPGRLASYLSTHPTDEKRLERITKRVAELKAGDKTL